MTCLNVNVYVKHVDFFFWLMSIQFYFNLKTKGFVSINFKIIFNFSTPVVFIELSDQFS